MLGYQIDPFVACIMLGIVWPIVQQVAQRASWAGRTKRFIAVGFAVVASVLVWFAGAYPASWQLFTTQFLVVFGAGQTVYAFLKGAGVFDWAQVGESDMATADKVFDYQGKHAGDSNAGERL